MASTKKTLTYELNQWVKTDPVLMDDFNADNQKIEAALLEKGNCRIQICSHVGNGTCGAKNPSIIYFLIEPQIVYIVSETSVKRFVRPCKYVEGGTTSDSLVTWGKRSLQWFCTEERKNAVSEQCNELNKMYTCIAIGL